MLNSMYKNVVQYARAIHNYASCACICIELGVCCSYKSWVPWGPLLRLSLWYEVKEAKNNCHKAKQEKGIHTQEDYPTNVILQGERKGRGCGRGTEERGKGQYMLLLLCAM